MTMLNSLSAMRGAKYIVDDNAGGAKLFGSAFQRKVGWSPGRNEANIQLRENVLHALKKEFKGTPAGDTFVKGLEKMLNGESGDKSKPLKLKVVQDILARGATMRAAYATNPKLKNLDQARGLANQLTDVSTKPMAKSLLRDQVSGAMSKPLAALVDRLVEAEVAAGRSPREARDGVLDKFMTPACLYHTRSAILAGADMGANPVDAHGSRDPNDWTVGTSNVGALAKDGIKASGVLEAAQSKLEAINNLPMSTADKHDAMMAALDHPEQPVGDFLVAQFGAQKLGLLQAANIGAARTLAEELAPDPEVRTARSGQQSAKFDELAQTVLGPVVDRLNSALPAGERMTVGSLLSKDVLAEVRTKIASAADGGQHKVTQAEAERAARQVLEGRADDMLKLWDLGNQASRNLTFDANGKPVGMNPAEAARMALDNPSDPQASVSAKFTSGWKEIAHAANEAAHGREVAPASPDPFSKSMVAAMNGLPKIVGLDAALSDATVRSRFDAAFQKHAERGKMPPTYSGEQLLRSSGAAVMQISIKANNLSGEFVKLSKEDPSSKRQPTDTMTRGDHFAALNREAKTTLDSNRLTMRFLADILTDQDFLNSVPAERRDALLAAGQTYRAILAAMDEPSGLWQQMTRFVDFATQNRDMAMEVMRQQTAA